MRQRYLVTYDICDARRLRKVFKVMKAFGDHLQLSVFRCDLSRMQLAEMKMRLLDVIDCEVDQVLMVDIGPTDGRGGESFDSLGRAYCERETGAAVV